MASHIKSVNNALDSPESSINFVCAVCNHTFDKADDFNQHALTHDLQSNDEKLLADDRHNVNTSLSENADIPLKVNTSSSMQLKSNSINGGEVCPFCDSCSPNLVALKQHILNSHKETEKVQNEESCSHCPAIFVNKSELNDHIILIHQTGGKIQLKST